MAIQVEILAAIDYRKWISLGIKGIPLDKVMYRYYGFSTNKDIWRSQVAENAIRFVKFIDHCLNLGMRVPRTIAEVPLVPAEMRGRTRCSAGEGGGMRDGRAGENSPRRERFAKGSVSGTSPSDELSNSEL